MDDIVVNHTFLLQPGGWTGTGWYQDRSFHTTEIHSHMDIRHTKGLWTSQGEMTLTTGSITSIQNHIKITPIAPAKIETTWMAESPNFGQTKGRLAIIGETLMLSMHSLDGKYSGVEYFNKINRTEYVNVGVIYEDGEVYCCWRLTLLSVLHVHKNSGLTGGKRFIRNSLKISVPLKNKKFWRIIDILSKILLGLFSTAVFFNNVFEYWSIAGKEDSSTIISIFLLICHMILFAWAYLAAFVLYILARVIAVFIYSRKKKIIDKITPFKN